MHDGQSEQNFKLTQDKSSPAFFDITSSVTSGGRIVP